MAQKTNKKVIAKGNHNGNITSHQDQLIYPNSLRTKKIEVITPPIAAVLSGSLITICFLDITNSHQ